ncbi:hypothetical protein [Rhodococcus jostii]|uniref:Uncharacterized protein n=1 Tax=Rhodococcus jostii TaxID=132919 RepID=A0ABU4CQH0_RHOJO|nr:hypothetical protein [Rhodococcus jostii]MDV6285811.1 hypothetical protein [Rhodococcus jostii]
MRTYNGAPAHTDIIAAGTELWRIHRTDSPFPPNSFNSAAIAPLEDGLTINTRTMRIPRQGRFDPVHDDRVCPGGSPARTSWSAPRPRRGCGIGAATARTNAP